MSASDALNAESEPMSSEVCGGGGWRAVRGACVIGVIVALTACGKESDPPEVVILDENNDGADMSADLPPGAIPRDDNTSQGKINSQMGQFNDCPVEARPIYVIDAAEYKLLSFDPTTLAFTEVGNVAGCPSQVRDATPFSMGVDREANAWVLYNSGEMFIYNISEKKCYPTNFRPNDEFALFGMGFVLDQPGSQTDVLYIAGDGSGPGDEQPSQLGKVEIATSRYIGLGATFEGDPELTGTASGELWGFFPDTAPAKVAQIDRESGALKTTFPMPQIMGDTIAWAFAFWGGDFWVFQMGADDRSSRVYKVETDDGSVSEVVSDSGYVIVGAGVSTCAPLQVM